MSSDAFGDEQQEGEGGPTITINEYLDELDERELEADLVLGGEDDECTYPKGYMKRQAVFSCLTCTPEGNAGVCAACAMSCHDGHEVLELWTKRNFRCDCGNSKFGNFICKLQASKDIENVENSYNHNFIGQYCSCGRPYPDPNVEEEEEMIQCCVCEDWFHREHLGLDSSEKVPMDDDGEPLYDELICQACAAASSFLMHYPQHIFVAPMKNDTVAKDVKGKGILQEAPSLCESSGNIEQGGCMLQEPENDVGIVKSGSIPNGEGLAGMTDSSASPCKLGVDLAVPPAQVSNRAMFLVRNWRESLCRCDSCSKVYDQKHMGFLLDKDDTIVEYEKRAKLRREERLKEQEGATLNSFNNMGHVEKVELVSAFAEMKNAMETFFASRDSSKTITAPDVYEWFDNLQKKRRRHM